MIQNILHFIWIGPQVSYVNQSINSYKALNKNFKINYIHYQPIQLENIYFNKYITTKNDKIVYNLLIKIFNKIEYYNIIIRQILFFKMFGNIPFLQLFCDILRLELLNIYGGIYVDCDTFAMKPFDSYILNLNNFCVYDKIEDFCEINNYFIGSNKEKHIDNYFNGLTPLYQTNNYMLKSHFKKPLDYQIRRIKFLTNKLSINDFKNVKTNNYIEHYSDFTWGKKKIQYTQFDKLFNAIYENDIKMYYK